MAHSSKCLTPLLHGSVSGSRGWYRGFSLLLNVCAGFREPGKLGTLSPTVFPTVFPAVFPIVFSTCLPPENLGTLSFSTARVDGLRVICHMPDQVFNFFLRGLLAWLFKWSVILRKPENLSFPFLMHTCNGIRARNRGFWMALKLDLKWFQTYTTIRKQIQTCTYIINTLKNAYMNTYIHIYIYTYIYTVYVCMNKCMYVSMPVCNVM